MGALADAYATLKSGTLWHNTQLASPKHPCKGFADANPGEAAQIDSYVTGLDAGEQVSPPALETATGRGLVGMLAALAPEPVPPSSSSGYPKQGVSVPLGAVANKNLDAYMSSVAALGNGHPMALRTDWWPGSSDFDNVRAAAEQHGITVLPILNYDPRNRPSQADFAKQAVQLANLGVEQINLLNEPNLGGWTPQDAANYVRAAYDAIKAVNPSCVVVAPDVAANSGAGKTPQSCVDWLKAYRAAGAKQDALAVNLYGDAEQLDTGWNLWAEIDQIKAAFPGTPIWCLEGGCKVVGQTYGTKWGTLTGEQYQDKCVATGMDAAARGVIDVYHVYSLYDDASPGGFGLYSAPGGAARAAVGSFKARAR